MGMKKNGVCIGRQTMDTAPMRTNEICPSYFLPLHAHSRVIFEICRSYFLPPFPPGTMLDDRHRIYVINIVPGGRGQKQDRQISKKIENVGIVWRCPYDFAHPIFLFPHKAGLDFGRQRRPKQDRQISMKHYLMGAFMLGWRCLQRVFFIVLRRSLCMRGWRCLQRFIFFAS